MSFVAWCRGAPVSTALRYAWTALMNLWVNLASCLALAVAMPRWIVGMLRGRYRWQDLAARLIGQVCVRTGDAPCLWLHAASVGEMNVLVKLLPSLERQYPEYELVVSSATTSGYQRASQAITAHSVVWFPLAFSWAAKRALRRMRPTAIVLVDFELAPTLVEAAQNLGIGLFVINGRLSQKRQRLLRGWPRTATRTLERIDRIFAQSADDAVQFVAFGARPEAVEVTGSIKFDILDADRHHPDILGLREFAGLEEDNQVFVAGSTKAGEELAALDAFRDLADDFPRLKLLVAPRNASRFQAVAKLLDASGYQWQRRSTLEVSGVNPSSRILLIDSLGELQQWWATADVAFVGGSLHAEGGQNMIEPAAYGAAVCFGPHTQNFRDVVSLLVSEEAAEVVHSDAELSQFVRRCLEDPLHAETLGWRARQVVQQQSGAIEATIAALDRGLLAIAQRKRGVVTVAPARRAA